MQDTFSGIWVPLVTPFTADGRVDTPRLAALARHLAFAGIRGFVVCGTTGEPATLRRPREGEGARHRRHRLPRHCRW